MLTKIIVSNYKEVTEEMNNKKSITKIYDVEIHDEEGEYFYRVRNKKTTKKYHLPKKKLEIKELKKVVKVNCKVINWSELNYDLRVYHLKKKGIPIKMEEINKYLFEPIKRDDNTENNSYMDYEDSDDLFEKHGISDIDYIVDYETTKRFIEMYNTYSLAEIVDNQEFDDYILTTYKIDRSYYIKTKTYRDGRKVEFIV